MCYGKCLHEDYNGDCTLPSNNVRPCVEWEIEAEEEERRLELKRAEIRRDAVDAFFDAIQGIRTAYLCSRDPRKEETFFGDIIKKAEDALDDMGWQLMEAETDDEFN